ncbi:MAG: class I SAM-dependent RNA methyltransferase [Rhodobacter sp.]|nr:class I SAM-dependent RNA methyltransferase [Paracoccaceae bacterium]MCB1410321.1 class I SAM-dependent RNA methyltransferase [Paracoccaceae bacterium]MCC0081202.1 class I SAM-dependent RNA methyltransferase [Rhodobacter sp.]
MTRIERLTLRGEGVGEGLVFSRVLPGETVEGVAVDGRVALPRILTPSPHRVSAPCRHYKACGGCALMHASDAFVADWKTAVVSQALSAQGIAAPFRPVLTSPPGTRRRATLTGRRLKSGALVGFHGRASDTVTAVPDCRLLDPALLAALPAMEALVIEGASRKAEMRLTATLFRQGVEIAVEGGKPLDAILRQTLPGIAARHSLVRLSWNGEILVQEEPPVLAMGRALVSPPPGAFLQATPQGEAGLLDAVRDALGPARHVADLFAGCGTFALPLAETAEVHAVEGAAAMLAALDRGWRSATGLKRVTTEARDLFRRPLLPEELARFDAVVIDPPRAGAEAQVAELARAAVPVIAHVSCNPVTFARDARTLAAAGYRLDWVQVVDQFRWSAHVELAARFSRD